MIRFRDFRGFRGFLTIRRLLGAVLAVTVVPACSSSGISSPGSAPSQVVPGALGRSANRSVALRYDAGTCPSSVVYVVSNYNTAVEIYDRAAFDAGPCGSVTGFSLPQGLFVDSKRGLWVADAVAQKIYRFVPGTSGPVATLSDPNGTPFAVAVEPSSGTVYVSEYQNNNNPHTLVEVYANGSTTPTGSLSDPNARNGGYAAVDSAGNLYVTFMTQANRGQVDRWIHGAGTPEDLGLKLISAGGIVTTASGALAVCDTYHSRCGIYAHGSTKISHVFGHMGHGNGGIQNKPPWLFPEALVLDRSEQRAYLTANSLSVWRFPGPKSRPNHLAVEEIKIPDGGADAGIAVSPASRPGAPW
jgi:hypothetical protein